MTAAGQDKRDITRTIVIRASICHVVDDPFKESNDANVLESFEDGALAIDPAGKILAAGPFAQISSRYSDAEVLDRRGCIVLPGFIDCHIHMPQALMIGAFGEELLDWLKRYTRPEEAKYKDRDYAVNASKIFFEEEIASGTTTAVMFGPHFEEALSVAFEEAERRNFRAIMGLTIEDRDLPAELALEPPAAYAACKRMIERWHGKGKLKYVVTPRFALTCSAEMLSICKRLLDEHPDVYFQSHLNENHKEILRLKELFPQSSNYLDVYDGFGLLGPRSLFHHSIYSTDAEIDLLARTESRVVNCPSSNMFIGSGLMPIKKYINKDVIVALGTDVGAGTGYSMLKEMSNAYQMQSLLMFAMEAPDQAVKLTGVKLLYMATLAGARALRMENQIGSFKPGNAADLVVIDPSLDSYLAARLKNTQDLAEKLFVLAIVSGKDVIREVYIDGRLAHARAARVNDSALAKPATTLG